MQAGILHALIRLHCTTLFGSYIADHKKLPPPATEAEKANWKMKKVNIIPDEDSDETSSASPGPTQVLMDLDINENEEILETGSEADPSFPYGANGPGHEKATRETLPIIWLGMQKVGLRSF